MFLVIYFHLVYWGKYLLKSLPEMEQGPQEAWEVPSPPLM